MTVEALVRWIQERALSVPDTQTLIAELAPRMEQLGLPLARLWHAFALSHPLFEGQRWSLEDGRIEMAQMPIGFFASFASMSPEQLGPAAFMSRGEPHFVAHARDGSSGYALVDAQFAAGVTTYFMLPIAGIGDEVDATEGHKNLAKGTRAHGLGLTAWSVSVPGGLQEAGMEQIRTIHAAFSLASRLQLERERSRTILHTYLGRDSGDRVHEGRIRRGDLQRLNAAIAFTDLRDFSGTAEREDPDRVLDLLNAAFDAQVTAIEAHGGHVLSFLGDGLLAIWPDTGDGSAACDQALAASDAIEAAVDALNPERRSRGALEIRYGIALHYGEVNYGNFGARHRLSFTVIGPAVNRAARLEGLGARLGIRPILSRTFADRVSAPCVPQGLHEAKGVGALEVWTRAPG